MAIDNRIVSLQFDNSKFDKNVQSSIEYINNLNGTLDSLNKQDLSKVQEALKTTSKNIAGIDPKSLNQITDAANKVSLRNLDRAIASTETTLNSINTTGIDKITSAADSVNLSNISNSVGSLETRFGAFGTFVEGIIKNIASSAYGMLGNAFNGILDTVVTKGEKRAANLEQAEFLITGLGYSWEQAYEDANYAVLDTAYGLDEAAIAAANLAASGIQQGDEMKEVLLGISGVAALTGSDYSSIAHIMTNIAGTGKAMMSEFNQFSTRGLNMAEYVSRYLNENTDAYNAFMDAVYSNVKSDGSLTAASTEILSAMDEQGHLTQEAVRAAASASLITDDIIFATSKSYFGAHAKEANKTYSGAVANYQAAWGRIGEAFITPYRDMVRDMANFGKPLVNLLKSEILSPIIELWKTGTQKVSNIVTNLTTIFNNVMRVDELGNEITVIKSIFMSISKIVQAIYMPVGQTIFDVLQEKFPVLSNAIDTLSEGTTKAMGMLTPIGSFADKIEAIANEFKILDGVINLLKGVLSIVVSLLKTIFTVAYKIVKTVFKAINSISPVLDNMGTIFGNILGYISKIFDYFSNSTIIEDLFDPLLSIIGDLFNSLKTNDGELHGVFSFIEDVMETIVPLFGLLFDTIAKTINAISTGFKTSTFSEIKNVIQTILDILTNILDIFITPITSFIKGIIIDISLMNNGIGLGAGLFKNIFSALGSIFKLIKLLLSPVLSIITTIKNAGIVEKILKPIRSILNGILGALSFIFNSVISPLINTVTSFLSENILGGITNGLTYLFNNVIMPLITNVSNFFTSIPTRVASIYDAIKRSFNPELVNQFKASLSNIKETFIGIFDTIKNSKALVTLKDAIVSLFDAIKTSFNAAFNNNDSEKSLSEFLNGLLSTLKGISDALSPIISVVFDLIGSGLSTIISGIASALNYLTDKIKGTNKQTENTITFWDKLKGVFEKIKPVIDGIISAITGVFSLIGSIFKSANKEESDAIEETEGNSNRLRRSVRRITSENGRTSESFDDATDSIDEMADGVDNLTEASDPFSNFTNSVDNLVEATDPFSNITDSVDKISDGVGNLTAVMGPFNNALKETQDLTSNMSPILQSIGNIFTNIFYALSLISDIVIKILESIKTYFTQYSFKEVLFDIFRVLSSIIGLKATNVFTDIAESFKKGVASLTSPINELKKTMMELQTDIKARTIKAVAVSIALIVGSIIAMMLTINKLGGAEKAGPILAEAVMPVLALLATFMVFTERLAGMTQGFNKESKESSIESESKTMKTEAKRSNNALDQVARVILSMSVSVLALGVAIKTVVGSCKDFGSTEEFSKALWAVSGVMSVLLAHLSGLAVVIAKIIKNDDTTKLLAVNKTIGTLSTAVLAISLGLKLVMSSISGTEDGVSNMWAAAGAIGAIVTAFAAIIAEIVLLEKNSKSRINFGTIGAMLLQMSIAVDILLIAIHNIFKTISESSDKNQALEDLWKSIAAVSALMAVLGTVAALLSKFGGKSTNLIQAGVSIMMISVGINALLPSIIKLSQIAASAEEGSNTLWSAVGSIAILIIAVAASVGAISANAKNAGAIIVTAVSLTMVIGALNALIPVMINLSQIKTDTLISTAITIGSLVAALSVIMFGMAAATKIPGIQATDFLIAASSMLIMAGAMVAMSTAINLSSSVPFEEFAKRLGILVGAIALLSIVLVGISKFSAAFVGLGGALALTGVGIFLVGSGVALVANQIIKLSNIGPEGIQNLINVFDALCLEIPKLGPALGQALLGFMEFLADNKEVLFNILSLLVNQLLDYILLSIQTVLDLVTEIVFMSLETLIKRFIIFVSTILETIQKYSGPIANAISEILSNIVIAVFNFFLTIGEYLVENKERIITVVSEVADMLIQIFANIFVSWLRVVSEKMPEIYEYASIIIENFYKLLGLILAQIVILVVETIVELLRVLSERMPEIVEYLTIIINCITDLIIDTTIHLIERLRDLLPHLTLLLKELGEDVIYIVIETLTTLLALLAEHMPEIVEYLKIIFKEITVLAFETLLILLETIKDYAPDIIAAIIGIVTGIVKGIAESLPDIIEAGISIIMGLIEGIAGGIPQIVDQGAKIIVKFCDGMSDAIENNRVEIRRAVKRLITTVKDTFIYFLTGKDPGQSAAHSGAGDTELASAGKSGLAALLDGMKNAAANVWETIKGIGEAIKDGFCNFFNIHSPSEVMADEVGRYITEGVAVGMTDATPSAVNAAEQSSGEIKEAFEDGLVVDTSASKSAFDEIGGNLQEMFGSMGDSMAENFEGSEKLQSSISGLGDEIDFMDFSSAISGTESLGDNMDEVGNVMDEAFSSDQTLDLSSSINDLTGEAGGLTDAFQNMGANMPTMETEEISNSFQTLTDSMNNANISDTSMEIDGLDESMSSLSDTMNGLDEDDLSFTITPVMDLSEVEKSKSELDELIGDNTQSNAIMSNDLTSQSDINDENTIDFTPDINTLYSTFSELSSSTKASNIDSSLEGNNLSNLRSLAGATNNTTFIQNNYSPQALSRIDIYRQTNNQLSSFQEVYAQ